MANKKKKRWLLWTCILGIGFILVMLVAMSSMKGGGAPEVEVDNVKVEPELVAKVTGSGEIKPKQYVNIQSEIAGVITALYVNEGDAVKSGDILMKVDPIQTEADTRTARYQMEAFEQDANATEKQIQEARLNVIISKANLKSADADLAQAMANLNREKSSYERKEKLYKEKLISDDDFNAADASLQVAKSRVDAARANVDQIRTKIDVSDLSIQQMQTSHAAARKRVDSYKAQLFKAEDMLNKTTLTSPLTGVITKLNVEKGERAVPGNLNNPSATLMTIADLSIIEAEIKVDETDIIHLAIGQTADVKVDALPDQILKGHVTEIGNSAITAGATIGGGTEAKDFKVVVQLDNPPKNLRPGLSATVEIMTGKKKNVTAVPLQALVSREVELDAQGKLVPKKERPKETASDGTTSAATEKKNLKEQQGVFLVKNDKVVFTPVTTGITGSSKIEIISGVKAGDEIVVGSFKVLRTLKDGMTVTRKKADQGGPDKAPVKE